MKNEQSPIEFISQPTESEIDSFDVYMNSVIVPKVDETNSEKDKYRGQFWTYFWTFLFLVSVNALVVLYRALMYHHPLRVDQLIFINIIAVVIVCWPLYSWRKHEKEDVFDSFLGFYGNFKHIKDVETQEDVELAIVPAHNKALIKHEFNGDHNGVDIAIRDVVYLKQRATSVKKVVSGVLLAFDFHQLLENKILLFEKYGFYRKHKMADMVNLNEHINIPAANYFNVFADDMQSSSSYLCSAFFEKVLDLKDVFGARKIYIALQDSYIKIFLEGTQIYFDNHKLWSRKIEYDKFRRLHKQFEEVFIFSEIIQAILRNR